MTLILTSKTRSEIQDLFSSLQLQNVFVVELKPNDKNEIAESIINIPDAAMQEKVLLNEGYTLFEFKDWQLQQMQTDFEWSGWGNPEFNPFK